jgi:hypothetical protein
MRYIILIAFVLSFVANGFRFADQPAIEQRSEPAGPVPLFQQSDANIGFEWAFGVIAKEGKTLVPISVNHDTVLKSGDKLKMMVKLTKDCFVYVVYYDSQGEINLLFPYTIGQLQTDYVTDKIYYIPKGRSWMSLDSNTGKEKFFLIASSERLLELEAKLGNYFSAEPSTRKPLADGVVSEIRDLRKQFTTFATLAEKPLTIGGNIRSTDTVKVERRPDVADIAAQIEANNFYSKTFTIDHQ